MYPTRCDWPGPSAMKRRPDACPPCRSSSHSAPPPVTDRDRPLRPGGRGGRRRSRRSEEHTSELQSLMRPSYAVFCLKKKIINRLYYTNISVNNNTITNNKHQH